MKMSGEVAKASFLVGFSLLSVACSSAPKAPAPAAEAPKNKSLITARSDRDGDGVDDVVDRCPSEKEDQQGMADNDGCGADHFKPPPPPPALPPPPRLAVADRIELKESIRFEAGSATIDPASDGLLRTVAGTIASHPELDLIEVAGHADAQGADEQNRKLTQARADAVARRLIAEGVEAKRLRAVGYGSLCPMDAGKDEAAMAKNRRVELLVIRRDGKDLAVGWGGCPKAEKAGIKRPPPPAAEAKPKGPDVPANCPAEALQRELTACEGNVPDACWRQFESTQKQRKEGPECLYPVMMSFCQKGSGSACMVASQKKRFGPGDMDPRITEAATIAQRGCTLGDGRSCVEWAIAANLTKANGTMDEQTQRTIAAGAKACELSYAPGCSVGRYLVNKSDTKARGVALLERGCSLDDSDSCASLASAEHAGGDKKQSLAHSIQACRLGGWYSCEDVTKQVNEGAKVDDPERLLEMAGTRCAQSGDEKVCRLMIALLESMNISLGKAPPARCAVGDTAGCQAACEGGDPKSCVRAAMPLAYGGPANLPRAFELARKGCLGGDPEACNAAGLFVEGSPDAASAPGRAGWYFMMACDQRFPAGCANYSQAPRHLAKQNYAADLRTQLDHSCSDGEVNSCYLLGRFDEEKNKGQEGPSYKRACEGGVAVACKRAKAGH